MIFRSRFLFATPIEIAAALRHMDLTHEQATDPTILKKRYLDLVIKYHPDSGGDAARLKEVVNGFALLQGLATPIEMKTSFMHREESHVEQSPTEQLYGNRCSWLQWDQLAPMGPELAGLCGMACALYVVYWIGKRIRPPKTPIAPLWSRPVFDGKTPEQAPQEVIVGK